ncbi:MAG TPA: redoxin domain-containing protein, partial [Rubrivivax sp.]|nr:redoxin domain-containing protein [Rubrivivax sp.]
MMNKSFVAASVLALAASVAGANAVVGQPAPAFSAVDAAGKAVSLADFKGKHVVLEWVNPGCPFVQKHYSSGNMKGTQKEATAKGV